GRRRDPEPRLDSRGRNFPTHRRKRTLRAMVETAPPSPRSRRARDLAAATPETRNRYADLLRVASIFIVVIGHWLMAILEYEDGSFVGKNLLERDLDPHPHVDLPGHGDLLHRRRVHQRGLVAFGEPARRVVRDLAACAFGPVTRTRHRVRRLLDRPADARRPRGTPVRDGADRRARGGAPDMVPGRLHADGRGGTAATGGASAVRRACARGARGGSGNRRRGAVRVRRRMDR